MSAARSAVADMVTTPLEQVLIGGALTIAGGFGATWLQISRADKVARNIRREERREQELLKLHDTTREVCERLSSILHGAEEHGMSSSAYMAALQAVRDLGKLWLFESTGAIRDADLLAEYTTLDRVARQRLPDSAAGMEANRTGDWAKDAQRFMDDLGAVLDSARQSRQAVDKHVAELALPEHSWRQGLRSRPTD